MKEEARHGGRAEWGRSTAPRTSEMCPQGLEQVKYILKYIKADYITYTDYNIQQSQKTAWKYKKRYINVPLDYKIHEYQNFQEVLQKTPLKLHFLLDQVDQPKDPQTYRRRRSERWDSIS